MTVAPSENSTVRHGRPSIVWVAAMTGVGPRVEESGIGLVAGYAFFSSPYEDVKLKAK